MNYNEFLNQYFDGTLGEAEQQVFFSALADDSVLRQEFNDEMLVRNTVRASVFAEAPPADLTNSIFSAVGYSGNTAVGIAPAVQSSYFMKIGGYLISFAVGCVAIWLWSTWENSQSNFTSNTVISQQMQPQRFNNNSSYNSAVQDNHATNENYSPRSRRQSMNTERATSFPIKRNNQSTKQSDLSLNSILPTSKNTMTSEFQSAVLQEPVINSQVQISKSAIQNFDISQAIKYNSVSPIKQHGLFNEETSLVMNSPKNFSASLRSLQTVPASGDIASNDRLGINNIALALFYKADKHFAIGLETGREAFYQEYTHQTDSSTDFIKQNPTMWWGGAALKGEIPELGWNETIYPFAQVGGGLAESGAYLRTSTGVCFAPLDIISMNIGVDWTLLRYSAYNLQYSTQKVGWSYSINIRF